MSGGRVELGIGAGWYDAEHAAYAIPFPPDRRALRPARGPARDPHRPVGDARGRDVLLRRLALLGHRLARACPKPAQRPHPPIIIGGKGAKRTPALTARYAAEFNLPFVGLEESPSSRSGASARPARRSAATPTSLVYSNALHRLLRHRRGRDQAPGRVHRPHAGGPARERPRRHARRRSSTQIGRYAALGAQRVYLQVLDLHDLDHLEPARRRGHAARLNRIRSGRWRRDDRCRCRGWDGRRARARRTTWRWRRTAAGRRRR